MRTRPARAHWLRGYQAQALYQNDSIGRKAVVSIFKEVPPSPISRRFISSWKRGDSTGAKDND